MKFLFIVQGEGRGHMTQAISFSQLLSTQGHELVAVIVGKSKRREIPSFFEREIKAPISLVDSPNFECDASQKKINLTKTIWKNSLKVGSYQKSLNRIHHIVTETQPDIILNFYDLLGGLYNFWFRPKAQFWVIGHQYMIWHPDFRFAPNRALEKILFQLNTKLTGLGADEVLGLSFLPQKKSTPKVQVVPPLLRREVKNLDSSNGDYFLTYMVNPGYAEEVFQFAKANPQLRIKAYWDKKDAAECEFPLPNLSFHRVNDRTFLADMAACRGLVCTAGFESVCEAMYLGKPVMVIPVAGQYEQACNALEIEQNGIGIPSKSFDFGWFESQISEWESQKLNFQIWQLTWGNILQGLLQPEEYFSQNQSPSLELG
ncbi:glycosyltransferase family protein [Algoriphagus hitonicola]|uniref:Glycosyltransferase n=1 Tax=Algoriphagus hitonicola TaxID=435880 RepID=A0A1I2NXY1_9BACT|nr:glycosyltransferase family protein [Algoriphagus hitonicola]SFG08373.1 conserved hypothetical protein [Algoriphagus hitonicola]